jgi:hypothetical protein
MSEAITTGARSEQQNLPAVNPEISSEHGMLQRKCACGTHTIAGGECNGCSKERETSFQRSAINRGPANGHDHTVPPIVNNVLRSSGQPLDMETRAFMEPRFGHDFSHVRVHTDLEAALSAQAMNARAYTTGRDVVFGPGQYSPSSRQGRTLLAHELTHIIQQSNGSPSLQANSEVSTPGEPAEVEADRVAEIVMAGQSVPQVHSSGRGIQRDANTCTYGEIRSWAITSLTNFAAPAGLGGAKASIGAACTAANCNCVDGSAATAPGDQHSWTNIVAASGADATGGGRMMCVGTQQCGFVHQCRQCVGGTPTTVERPQNLVPTGTATVTNKGTLYFYSDPLQGWCNADDRRTACRAPQPRPHGGHPR